MWFVNSIFPSPSSTTFGLANLNGNGIAIASAAINQNRIDTVAHEIGHNLGLDHGGGKLNLMEAGSNRTTPGSVGNIFPNGLKADQLTASQISKARNSRFARPLNTRADSENAFYDLANAFTLADEQLLESDTVAVPESSTALSLLGIGLGALVIRRQSNQKKDSQKIS